MIDMISILVYNGIIKEVSIMKIAQKVNTAAAYKGISQAQIARSIGLSPANFNKRLTTGKFTIEELENIAEAIGAKYNNSFDFPDGFKV